MDTLKLINAKTKRLNRYRNRASHTNDSKAYDFYTKQIELMTLVYTEVAKIHNVEARHGI